MNEKFVLLVCAISHTLFAIGRVLWQCGSTLWRNSRRESCRAIVTRRNCACEEMAGVAQRLIDEQQRADQQGMVSRYERMRVAYPEQFA
jgi:hypothetical protein